MLLSACTPPLSTFIIGTGKVFASSPPIDLYNGRFRALDAALATARLTPSRAFAPSRDLFSVPSRAIIFLSIACWSKPSKPTTASRISELTLATACNTPLPKKRFPPSRNSTASCSPVDAPEGTMARPVAPVSSSTSTSTVGLPRESKTSRPRMLAIAVI
ncbi:unannotated protein [freshwater metagenome]|uniref:Unannotated protein n=1 Tax=freshwater metagenome TaxID=449393 RepID=A0A6J6GH70_9ZZZZ